MKSVEGVLAGRWVGLGCWVGLGRVGQVGSGWVPEAISYSSNAFAIAESGLSVYKLLGDMYAGLLSDLDRVLNPTRLSCKTR